MADAEAVLPSEATAAQVLSSVNFDDRVAEVELKVPATVALAERETCLAKRNQMKRKLYVESELIRIEIEERLNELDVEKLMLTSPTILEATARLNAIRKQLALDVLPMEDTQFEKVYMYVRFLTFVVLIVGWFIAISLLIPVRWLTPTLRRLGVKNSYLPMDIISSGMAKIICLVGGVEASTQGKENLLNLKDSVVCMFSHASNLDGFIVNGQSPVSFNYAGKKSLFLVPFLGWVSRWGFGYFAIDRSNRKSAMKSLKEMAEIVDKHGRSVAIAPEGTRSKDGLLQDFKKGPFYLRDDTKKNVIPAVIYGAYELWPPGRLFSKPGRALVRFLPEFKPDPSKSRNINRLALRRIYLHASADDIPATVGSASDANGLLKNMFVIYLVWCLTLKVAWTGLSIANTICFVLGITFWTYMKLTCLVVLAVEAVMFFTC